MKHYTYIFLMTLCLTEISAKAQTPFDSFAPETSRPMLGLDAITARENPSQGNGFNDSIRTTGLSVDDVSKWLSVDPLADKYPNISPYAYCGWNPVKFVDPDGEKITITGEDGVTITYIPGVNYGGNDSFTRDTYSKLDQLDEMFSNTDFMYSIVNSVNIYNILSEESMEEGTHNFNNGNINIGTSCSIDGIGHELFHTYQDVKGQGGSSIYNEVEAYLFQGKIIFTIMNGAGSFPLTAAEKPSSKLFDKALNMLIYGSYDQAAFNTVVREFKASSNANNLSLYNSYPLIRSNQTQSLIKQFYPIHQ